MARFTAWTFETVDGADDANAIVRDAASEKLVTVIDHAVVRWPESADKPETDVRHDDAKRGTGWGAFWGLLLGGLFFVPLVGAAAGAAVGGLSRLFSGIGLRSEDIERIREGVKPGTSALFLVTEQGDVDRFAERLHGVGATLVDANLTEEEKALLLQSFGGR
ncbi:Uncharacterized membrane protein [Paraoerskovia marina]|uniref:Uncharacterized membrane protein n=1 Tax=Paraoerskovia marina TaxID=545619 RepID=A0A1H1MJV7_9CELL|nr:DUF1269 domain-containing protein [Paraoerskovia marina]SDR87063.1 Uncharacterized membrane protein [Paraoerskovia marina]